MRFEPKTLLPVEVVFSPDWWHSRYGFNFDRDFLFNPIRRVEDERRMRDMLAKTFPDLGLGEIDAHHAPVVGAVHLAAGYFVAEALGCGVVYHDDAPPDVIPLDLSDEDFESWQAPEGNVP